jgi:probable HAF family extracellular repeat protein
MWFRSWLDTQKANSAPARALPTKRTTSRQQPAIGRLMVEPLEDRCLLSNYTVTYLGSLGGSSSAVSASGLNDIGQVVGSAQTASGDVHAFLWQKGAMTDLGTLGGPSSSAADVNNAGQIVGSATRPDGSSDYFLINPEDTDFDGTPDRWFRDTNGDGVNDLMAVLPIGGKINNLGQVVSGHLLWTPNVPNGTVGSLTDLGPGVIARAINDAGEVVGNTVDPMLWTVGVGHMLLWSNGIVTDLGEGDATDINSSGQITGNGPTFNLWGGYGSFVWTPSTPHGTSGTFASLPIPWAYGFDYAYSLSWGMNDTAQFFGDYFYGSYANDYGTGSDNGYPVVWSGGQMSEPPIPPSAAVEPITINNPGQLVGGNYLLTPISGPQITISDTTVTEGNTGTKAANFTVTLSEASSQPISVAFATADWTATGGIDYRAASGTLIIPAGQTAGTVTVLVNGDRVAEPNETFLVNLSGATNATIADAQGIGTIVDDEPRISISDVAKKEGRRGQLTLFTFTITLSAAYDQPVTMSFKTTDGTAKTSDNDYVAKTGTLTFAPGQTTKTITIEVKGDNTREADETFYLDLFGNSSNSLFAKSRATGTILNDD